MKLNRFLIQRVRAAGWRAFLGGAALAAVLGALLPLPLPAQSLSTNFYHPRIAAPGGLDWHPAITNYTKGDGSVTLGWFGVQPPYQAQSAPSLGGPWANFGAAVNEVNGGGVTAAASGEQNFFRVQGANPNFLGSSKCSGCHSETYTQWSATGHKQAFQTLKNINSHTNASCLPCHTVGYGAPTGFKDETATAGLAGVQCENCHGPAGYHRANFSNDIYPVITPAAEVCGGCHNGEQHPTFDEWGESAHSRVEAEVASSITAAAATNAVPRMLSCGPCHSGAVRLALLRDKPLPSAASAVEFGVTCSVCHDPHSTNNPAQLRNPVFSTNSFSYNTSASTNFAGQYNANVQVCGQCHNMRGAQWTDTSRPPHHSPQYNLLIGQGGYANTAPMIGVHGMNTNQCAQCHTHPHTSETGAQYTGHAFEVTLNGCATAGCHSDMANASSHMLTTQTDITGRLNELKALLNSWATTKAPDVIRTQYNAQAWEYSTPGALSNPESDPNIKGPTSTLQANIPAGIKQARFNAYLVLHDGSRGVHNADYARWLLDVAKTNVQAELNKP